MSTATALERSLSTDDRTEIKQLLARYVQLVDNGAWEHAADVFSADAHFAGRPLAETIASFPDMVRSRPVPMFPHQCSDPLLRLTPTGAVRSWSKFFTVRADGSVTSGDYMDTIVRNEAGQWRISERQASMGNRPPDDPFGASARNFDLELWQSNPSS